MKIPRPPGRFAWVVATLVAGSLLSTGFAEDWGAYALVPASARSMVLEATGAGTEEGGLVSIGKPAGTANQKWILTPRGNGLYAIRPSSSSTLVLAAAKGGAKTGTPMVLETDRAQPSQSWTLTRHENGSYSLQPGHAPELGLDDFGGNSSPGATIDLWTYQPNDQHLQWFIQALAGSSIAGPTAEHEAPSYEAPPIKPEEILPGSIKQFTFNQSAIFPGSTREVTVFIPAQYDAAKPACVYVKTDGYNPKEKELMETMIATKEIPVTVGVFVRPGDLPAPMKGTLGRRNRCFEYDGVSDDNVRFLHEELLPFIAKEYSLNLSTDGNDRCISGGSSGGIAAFTAAWLRPDAFSRVYAASGSFVAFRGGNEYPTLVRKFEPKPVRAFLTTGTHDMENCAGDWFLLDQEMDKALKFSGYDYVFRKIEGGHVAGYMDNYREAMAYLWKGWPARVQAGPGAPRAQDVLLPGEGWQLVAEGFKLLGSAACNEKGEVFFADPAQSKIFRLRLDGKVTDFATDRSALGGLTVGADGRLYAVSELSGRLVSYDADGQGRLVAEGLFGHAIIALPDGALYITADRERADRMKTDSGWVWHVKNGEKKKWDTGLDYPTGLALRPDQWLLGVAGGLSNFVSSFQVEPDGSLKNGERFFHLHTADWDNNADAKEMCYAKEGQLFIATRSGIQICADDGPVQVILPLPGNVSAAGVCLGGADGDTLFAFSSERIWKRKVKVHVVGAFTPWTKVNGTKL